MDGMRKLRRSNPADEVRENKKNQIRVICTKCGVEMVRTVVSRRHDVIDMYAPAGMEHSDLELGEH